MLRFGRYSNRGILANAYTMGGGYPFLHRVANSSPADELYLMYAFRW